MEMDANGRLEMKVKIVALLYRGLCQEWVDHVMLCSFKLLICLADVPSRSSCFSSRSACGRLMMG